MCAGSAGDGDGAAGATSRLGHHARGCPQRQTLYCATTQVRAWGSTLRPYREETENPSPAGPARGVPAMHSSGDEANPEDSLLRSTQLPPGVGQDRPPIRRLIPAPQPT